MKMNRMLTMEPKLSKEELTDLLARLECPTSVPVYSGDKQLIMSYEVIDLFSKFGNGDGDDEFLCEIANIILDEIQAVGVSLRCLDGWHNARAIGEIFWNGKDWPLDDAAVSDDCYEKIFAGLPGPMRETLVRLSLHGITVGYSYDEARQLCEASETDE